VSSETLIAAITGANDNAVTRRATTKAAPTTKTEDNA
jgi:hypothetical protein